MLLYVSVLHTNCPVDFHVTSVKDLTYIKSITNHLCQKDILHVLSYLSDY